MKRSVQTILIPVDTELPHSAISYAQILSQAYGKPISFLCLDHSATVLLEGFDYPIILAKSSLDEALNEAIDEVDPVMIVFQSDGRFRSVFQQLKACRNLRIPYFFVPKGADVKPPKQVVLPMSFLIEDREKAVWARSLYRYFKSHFMILKPNDKGRRGQENVQYVEAFFTKEKIPFDTIKGKKSSFKIDREAIALFSSWADLLVVTASREYGLDDLFLGPRELNLIRKSNRPIMMLNPRDDLYVLCGD